MNARRRIQRRQRTTNSNSAHVAHLKRKKSMLSRRARGVVLYMYVSRRNRRTRARWNRIDDTVQLFTRRISRAIRARWLFFSTFVTRWASGIISIAMSLSNRTSSQVRIWRHLSRPISVSSVARHAAWRIYTCIGLTPAWIYNILPIVTYCNRAERLSRSWTGAASSFYYLLVRKSAALAENN